MTAPDPQDAIELDELRQQIDAIDKKLLQLFNQRAQLAVQVGDYKKKRQLPIYDPQREAAILNKLCQYNPGPLPAEAITRLFERVIDEARHLERVYAKQREDS